MKIKKIELKSKIIFLEFVEVVEKINEIIEYLNKQEYILDPLREVKRKNE